MMELNRLTEEEILLRLGGVLPSTHDFPGDSRDIKWRDAGVLIPFVRIEEQWHLLFIRRSTFEHDKHSGQVAFAGGKYEDSDQNLVTTALREAHEEIGVQPGHVRVLGQLNHHYTISNFRVVPLVGIVPWPYELQLDPQEVAHAFTIPLNWLSNSSNYEIRQRQLAVTQNSVPVVYFDEYEGELLWGATARMVLSLIELLKMP